MGSHPFFRPASPSLLRRPSSRARQVGGGASSRSPSMGSHPFFRPASPSLLRPRALDGPFRGLAVGLLRYFCRDDNVRPFSVSSRQQIRRLARFSGRENNEAGFSLLSWQKKLDGPVRGLCPKVSGIFRECKRRGGICRRSSHRGRRIGRAASSSPVLRDPCLRRSGRRAASGSL